MVLKTHAFPTIINRKWQRTFIVHFLEKYLFVLNLLCHETEVILCIRLFSQVRRKNREPAKTHFLRKFHNVSFRQIRE